MVVKTFDINTADKTPFEHSTRRLLLELAHNQLTVILWDKKADTLQALEQFRWSVKDTEPWDKMVQQSALLVMADIEAQLFATTEALLIVPEALYAAESSKTQLDAIFGAVTGEIYQVEKIGSIQAMAVWKTSDELLFTIGEHFKTLQTHHLAGHLINAYKPDVFTEGLLVFLPHQCWCVVFSQGKLQLVRSIAFETAEDLSYHLLNTCETLGIAQADMHWHISGQVEKNSMLFETASKYFTHTNFMHAGIEIGADVHPHYFAHLLKQVL